jgi:hypothetical protein
MKKLPFILIVLVIAGCTAYPMNEMHEKAPVKHHFTVNRDYETVYNNALMYVSVMQRTKLFGFSLEYEHYLYPEKLQGLMVAPYHNQFQRVIEFNGQPDGTTKVDYYSTIDSDFYEKLKKVLTECNTIECINSSKYR